MVQTAGERVARLRFINSDRTRLPVSRRIRPRGVPNALQDHPVLDTTDLALATDLTSQLLGHCQVVPDSRGRTPFHCRLHAVQVLDVTMAHLDYGAPATVTVPHATSCYTVHMTSAGHASVRIGGETLHLSPFFALIVSPGDSYTLMLEEDSPQTIVRIEQETMEGQLSRLLGRRLDEPICFAPLSDLTTDAAARWHGALQILSNEVLSPQSLVQQGYGAGPLQELIVSTLLYVQTSNYSQRLHRRKHTPGRAAVSLAVEYIEHHLAEPISLGDIAAYARMSPRSIQAGFREDLGSTPIAYVRDRRLDAVRRDLLAARPGDGLSVTDIATRWCFTHPGNFSRVYRQRFGEPPSRTLRGSRSA